MAALWRTAAIISLVTSLVGVLAANDADSGGLRDGAARSPTPKPRLRTAEEQRKAAALKAVANSKRQSAATEQRQLQLQRQLHRLPFGTSAEIENGENLIVHMSQGATAAPNEWFGNISAADPASICIWGVYGPIVDVRKTQGCLVVDVRNTTWTEGRNRMYFTAMAFLQGKPALFYVFYDGDVDGVHAIANAEDGKITTTPRVKYEDEFQYWLRVLRTERPAIASVLQSSKGRSGGVNHKLCLPSQGTDQIGTDQDAIVTAFHHDAATVMLPYETIFDNETWWGSQGVVIEMAHILYPQATVEYNAMFVINIAHSRYPQAFLAAPWKKHADKVVKYRVGGKCAERLVEQSGEYDQAQRKQRWQSSCKHLRALHRSGRIECCHGRFHGPRNISYAIEAICD